LSRPRERDERSSGDGHWRDAGGAFMRSVSMQGRDDEADSTTHHRTNEDIGEVMISSSDPRVAFYRRETMRDYP
jgi:hypothetical protein